MLFFAFLGIFAILINKNFISYNENLLLCVFFILFFIIAYILISKIFKEAIFKQILKNFFLILLAARITNFFNNLIINTNAIKYNIIKKYYNKILLLKKKYIINISSIIHCYFFIIMLLYVFLVRSKFIIIKELSNNELELNNKIKEYDLLLFF